MKRRRRNSSRVPPSFSPHLSHTSYNNESDPKLRQRGYTQHQPPHEYLNWALGFVPVPVNGNQLNSNSQEFLPWRTGSPQWGEVHSYQPLCEPDFNSNPPFSQHLGDPLELFGASSEDRFHNNHQDTTSLIDSDATLLLYQEPTPFLSQPGLAALAPEDLTFSFNDHNIYDGLGSSGVLVDGDVARMGCWDESLDHRNMFERSFDDTALADFNLFSADISTERHRKPRHFPRCSSDLDTGPLDLSRSAEHTSTNSSNFHYDHVHQSDVSGPADPLWSSAAFDPTASEDLSSAYSISDREKANSSNHTSGHLSQIILSNQLQGSISWPSLTTVLEDDLAYFDSGFVPDIYIPTSNKVADNYRYLLQRERPQIRRAASPGSSYEKSSRISEPLAWDHTAPSQLQRFGYVKEVKDCLPAGRRKGRLNAEQAKKAKEIRKLHACLPCWLSKVPVGSSA